MKANTILDTIGRTPHIRVQRLFPNSEVWIKSERSNPGGSIKDRMARHGGKVQLRSTPGAGTEVGLVLPRARRGTPSATPVSEEETR